VFGGRGAVGYDHGYDGEVFYLGLALDPNYVEGFVECEASLILALSPFASHRTLEGCSAACSV
jgi:hypothetical protein